MFEDTMQYFKRIVGIESTIPLENANGLQADYPKTVEQPTSQEEEKSIPLYKERELKSDLCDRIQECYPSIQKLGINIVPSKNYIGNGKYVDRYYLSISWENGASENLINTIVACTLNDYFDYTHGEVPRSLIRVHLKRIFTEEIIMRTSKKYADCIALKLPINMHNVHCFKVGGVPIYDLALGELSLMDNVKV